MATATETGNARTDQPARSTAMQASSQSTALSVYDRIADPVEFINRMGATFYNSKMFGCNNIDQGKALAFRFLVKREDPFEFRLRHHIIGGNLTMSAEAMLADFRSKLGGSHRIISRTPEKASVELSIGRQKQIFEFSWDEAKLEPYCYTNDANDGRVPKVINGQPNPKAFKDNWSTPRRRMQMLWWRAVADGVGAMAPEISAGHVAPEELDTTIEDAQAASATGSAGSASATSAADESIVDGEFTVHQAAAETAKETAKPEADESANGHAAVAEQSAGTQQTASTATAPAETSAAAPKRTVPPEKQPWLKELGALKKELLSDETYRKVLDKYGVKSAFDLDLEHLQKIVYGLRERKKSAEMKDDLSKWADKACGTDGAEASGENPSGN